MKLTPEGLQQVLKNISAVFKTGELLRDKEEMFLTDILTKIDRFGSEQALSQKQLDWIEAIHDRVMQKAEQEDGINAYPYADTGGTSFHQQRGYLSRPRKRK